MIGNLSPTFGSALHNALNGQLLLFQHAHPEIPVAAMQPGQALDLALGFESAARPQDRFWRMAQFQKKIFDGLRADVEPEFSGLVDRPAGSVAPDAMIQGVLKVFEEPLKKVLERFQAAEPVRKNPNDEGAWQVYGDWLLERRDLRGEVIQLELQTEERKKLRGWKIRKQDLINRLKKDFVSEFSSINPHHWTNWQRGYLRSVFPRPHADQNEFRQVFAREDARFLCALELSPTRWSRKQLEEYLRLPQMQSVTELILYRDRNAFIVEILAALPQLRSLRSLSFTGGILVSRGWGICDEGAQALMNSQNLSWLRKLDITCSPVGDGVIDSLQNWARERGIELVI